MSSFLGNQTSIYVIWVAYKEGEKRKELRNASNQEGEEDEDSKVSFVPQQQAGIVVSVDIVPI